MIDEIIFCEDKNITCCEISPLSDECVLYVPFEEQIVKLKESTLSIGKKVLDLFEEYDIVYMDTRYMNASDLGMGFLSTFGFQFYDYKNELLSPNGLNLYYIDRVEKVIDKVKDKKLRLIVARPNFDPFRSCKYRVYNLSPLELEMFKRSFINLKRRLKASGLNMELDLNATEGGGFSTIVTAFMKAEHIDYYQLDSDYAFTDRDIELKKFFLKEGFTKMSDKDHNFKEAALKLHEDYKGKVKVESKYPLTKKEDLSLLYTPGVAEPCKKIHENKEDVYKYTAKGNLVAVVTDGSAVLGLGNIGPEAGMPVMEGKAILFKHFGGVDAFPILIDSQDTEKIIETVKMIAPTFGGINLEDIAAPRCFEIERRLKEELNIPVFHDDQHGTAIVVTAGIINALKVVGKKAEDVKVVINGCGAAGVAILYMMRTLGVKDILILDSKGIVRRGNPRNTPIKDEIAEITNKDDLEGDLKTAVKGADIFIGVSVAGALTEDMVKTMNKDAIIFAMANPVPEIYPDQAKAAGARVVGTGRSDYPNQINNLLCFPGLFRGALDARVEQITEDMYIAAAEAIAAMVGDKISEDFVIPDAMNMEVAKQVAAAVKRVAESK